MWLIFQFFAFIFRSFRLYVFLTWKNHIIARIRNKALWLRVLQINPNSHKTFLTGQKFLLSAKRLSLILVFVFDVYTLNCMKNCIWKTFTSQTDLAEAVDKHVISRPDGHRAPHTSYGASPKPRKFPTGPVSPTQLKHQPTKPSYYEACLFNQTSCSISGPYLATIHSWTPCWSVSFLVMSSLT